MKIKYLIIPIIFLSFFYNSYSGDFWEKLDFPVEDTIYTICIDDNDHIFVGTKKEGIFKSTDNGENWNQINNGLEEKRIWKLAINSDNDIFAIVGSIGIFRSTDNGENWQKINEGFANADGRIIAYSLAINNDGVLYVGIKYDQIYRSTDNGSTWQEITSHSDLNNEWIFNLAINSKGDIFACPLPKKTEGLYRSTDNGKNWTQLLGDSLNFASSISINSYDEILLGIYPFGIFRSINNGDRFDLVFNEKDTIGFSQIITNESNHIYASSGKYGVYRSIDNCDSWMRIDLGEENIDIRSMSFNKKGDLFAATWENGLYRSAEPMEKFYLQSEISPESDTTLDFNESVEYSLLIKDRISDTTLAGIVVNVIDSVMEKTTDIQTNDMGIAYYTTTIPEGKENGVYPITFITSKFGYVKDTIIRYIEVKHIYDNVEEFLDQNSFSVDQNPFCDAATIKYYLSKPEFIKLSLHNIFGREIRVLKEGMQNTGEHKIIFNNSGISSGVYFIRLEAGRKIITKKMLMIE